MLGYSWFLASGLVWFRLLWLVVFGACLLFGFCCLGVIVGRFLVDFGWLFLGLVQVGSLAFDRDVVLGLIWCFVVLVYVCFWVYFGFGVWFHELLSFWVPTCWFRGFLGDGLSAFWCFCFVTFAWICCTFLCFWAFWFLISGFWVLFRLFVFMWLLGLEQYRSLGILILAGELCIDLFGALWFMVWWLAWSGYPSEGWFPGCSDSVVLVLTYWPCSLEFWLCILAWVC